MRPEANLSSPNHITCNPSMPNLLFRPLVKFAGPLALSLQMPLRPKCHVNSEFRLQNPRCFLNPLFLSLFYFNFNLFVFSHGGLHFYFIFSSFILFFLSLMLTNLCLPVLKYTLIFYLSPTLLLISIVGHFSHNN